MTTQAPPKLYSTEMEAALLGSILIDAATWDAIPSKITAQSFYHNAHCVIFAAMANLRKHNAPVDYVSIVEELEQTGKIEEAGGSDYVTSLVNTVPTSANAAYYANIVLDWQQRRGMQNAGQMIVQSAYGTGVMDVDYALERAYTALDMVKSLDEEKTVRPLPSAKALLNRPRQNWLVRDLFQERSVAAIVAEANLAKTFAALHIALSYAVGMNDCWNFRMPADRGASYYIFGEGTGGAAKRIQGWLNHFGYTWDDIEGYFFPDEEPFDITNDAQVTELIERIRIYTQETGIPMRFVWLDTLSCVMQSGDENSNSDMARVSRATHRIKAETGATVVLLHHVNKEGLYRGASSLRGNVDTMLILKAIEEGSSLFTVTVDKQRDDEKIAPFTLKREQVKTGWVDEEDSFKDITSCVIVRPGEGEEPQPPEKKLTNKNDIAALRILVENTSLGYAKWLNLSGINENTFKGRNGVMARLREGGYALKSSDAYGNEQWTATQKAFDFFGVSKCDTPKFTPDHTGDLDNKLVCVSVRESIDSHTTHTNLESPTHQKEENGKAGFVSCDQCSSLSIASTPEGDLLCNTHMSEYWQAKQKTTRSALSDANEADTIPPMAARCSPSEYPDVAHEAPDHPYGSCEICGKPARYWPSGKARCEVCAPSTYVAQIERIKREGGDVAS